MSEWENWSLSHETISCLDKIYPKLKTLESPSLWWELFNFHFSQNDTPMVEIETEDTLNTLKEGEHTINLMNEFLDSNTIIEESVFLGLSFNSLFKIFESIRVTLCDAKFSTFCDSIISWSNDLLIEQALKAVVLPKLQEKNESSLCIIVSVTELAIAKPEAFCHYVLIQLLDNDQIQFEDTELLNSVFPVLPEPQKDMIILTVTSKSHITECDWFILQSLLTELSAYSKTNIINCICKWSDKYSKSQVFGRFLVIFCKNCNFLGYKNLLIEAIHKHETLLKRQALRFIE